jgi:hypothetical protein
MEVFMKSRRRVFFALCLLLVLLWSLEAAIAQPQAASFEQLQVIVKPGDTVYVTDRAGSTTRGRIAGLSMSSLNLLVNGTTRDFSQSDVFEIRQWRHDSLKNGALIGTGVAFGLTLATMLAYCDGDCGAGLGTAVTLFYTGVGAAVGVGVDALIPAKQRIYYGGFQPSAKKIQIKPVLGQSRRGVSVAVRF